MAHFNGLPIKEDYDYAPPAIVITQRNMGNEYILMQAYGTENRPFMGPFCVAIWHVKHKASFVESAKQDHKLYHLIRWLEMQRKFQWMRQIGFERGYEYMGSGRERWPFDFYYKVVTGEIKLMA